MKIAIFGSCVSRDTAEFIPGAEVVAYVARHSVTSLDAPHGTSGIDLSALTSAFQKRMVTSDLEGSGIDGIVRYKNEIDIVLIDLVDERRGFWMFPDGSRINNSLEVETSGAAREARRAGARLVRMGTDEHFTIWRKGFETLIDRLEVAGLRSKTILLDIEWATALEGAPNPREYGLGEVGRIARKLRRGARNAFRGLSNGRGLGQAWIDLWSAEPTEAEQFAKRASYANTLYSRYRQLARLLVASHVTRLNKEVRIGQHHRWGPQPFHYRDTDYRSICEEIGELHFRSNQRNQGKQI